VEERRSDRGRKPKRRARTRHHQARDRRQGMAPSRGSGPGSGVRRLRPFSCASRSPPRWSWPANDAALTTPWLASRWVAEKRPTFGRATAGVGTFLPGECPHPSSSGP